jgi:hypothetical protein
MIASVVAGGLVSEARSKIDTAGLHEVGRGCPVRQCHDELHGVVE